MNVKPYLWGIVWMSVVFVLDSANAFSIGTSPGVLNLGELESGRSYDFEFYLLTTSNNDLIVRLSYTAPHLDLYKRNHTGEYTFIPKYGSNADISDWVEFPQSPTVVTARPGPLIYVRGVPMRPNGKALVTLKVPEDAEPCYYIGTIGINPRVMGGGAGTGVGTIGVTRFTFVFKVKGSVTGRYRDGEILDIEGVRVGRDKARIDVLFKNTGVCTEFAYINRMNIYKDTGEHLISIMSGPTRVAPGETKILPGYWLGESMVPGRYRAQVNVNYFTGNAYGEKPVEIPEIITTPTGEVAPPTEPCDFPTDIILILAAVLLVIYWLNFDRKWLLLVLAASVMIALGSILMCNLLPWWIIVLPLFFIFLYYYYKS